MATHFICQSTEPLPHTYPTGSPQKTHGAVSHYELFNSSNKSHTQFPPPGWDFSQTSEEDSLPLRQPVPQPTWKDSSVTPDPDLLVTPQKPQLTTSTANRFYEKPSFNPDPLLCVTPEKSTAKESFDAENGVNLFNKVEKEKPRVRFDIKENLNDGSFIDTSVSRNLDSESHKKPVQSKPYQPELYGDNYDTNNAASNGKETDISVNSNSAFSHGRTVKYTVGKVNGQPLYIPLKDQQISEDITDVDFKELDNMKQTVQAKHESQDMKAKQTGLNKKSVKVIRENPSKVNKNKDNDDPIAACRGISDSLPKRKVKVFRENQYGPRLNDYTFPFNQGAANYEGGEEHMFARPEYNSTLRMKKEAEKLKESEIDVERALQKKLDISENTKTEINEKAASKVNPERAMYTGLVSLEVPVEKLCEQAMEMKTARAKQVKTTRSKATVHKEPDLMEFYCPDLQRESVTLSLPNVPAPSEQLSTASNWRAFDLYRHNRMWEKRGKRT